MQTVLLIIYHGMGHFNACFRLARILKKNYEVVIAGAGYFKDYVEAQGYIFYPLQTLPFGMGFEKWVNEQAKNKHPYFGSLKDRWTGRLYNLRETELTQLISDIEPDYLLIDSYQSTDFIVLYSHLKNHNTKVGFLQTMITTTISKNEPPITSLALPGDSKAIREAYKDFRFSKWKKFIKDKLRYFGMNEQMQINRRIRKNAIPEYLLSKNELLRGVSFTHIDELILAQAEFDFKSNKKLRYIGFLPDMNRVETTDLNYLKADISIREKVNSNNGILIYCSFGSVPLEDSEKINSFVSKLIQAVSDRNCVLIISLSSPQNFAKQNSLPENVFLFKATPQIQILERADVFITHGGLNSIKEALYCNVPMLVYPYHQKTDMMGNSSRVVFHKLGLRGDLLQDSPEDINEKIMELVNNDLYKTNIQDFLKREDEYIEKLLDVFQNLKSVNQLLQVHDAQPK